MYPTAPLTAADELLCHQLPQTFGVVGTSDLSWTEKVCAMAAATDGSLQLGFGLGRYPNRDVLDGYAAVSRGVEQLTVRASRRLSSDVERTAVGPITYEVLEPMRAVRFSLAPNDCQPIAFEWTFESIVPPVLEDRSYHLQGLRVASDLLRYHQVGVASGWVEVDGERTELAPAAWVSTRDHSWGTRFDVGVPMTDLAPRPDPSRLRGVSFRMIWCPAAMRRADGTPYGVHLHHQTIVAPGFLRKTVIGSVEHADGRVERIVDLDPDLRFDPVNRRLLGGAVIATMDDGSTRPFELEVVGDTGVHLGAGLYFGLDGHHHGEWRGESHLDGERIADCSTPEAARRLHQLRDTVVHVLDPTVGGEGWGNCQPIITGADEASGLDEESSFL